MENQDAKQESGKNIMQAAIAIILCILLSVLEVARIHESIMIAQAIQFTYVVLDRRGRAHRGKSKGREEGGEVKEDEGGRERG